MREVLVLVSQLFLNEIFWKYHLLYSKINAGRQRRDIFGILYLGYHIGALGCSHRVWPWYKKLPHLKYDQCHDKNLNFALAIFWYEHLRFNFRGKYKKYCASTEQIPFLQVNENVDKGKSEWLQNVAVFLFLSGNNGSLGNTAKLNTMSLVLLLLVACFLNYTK